MSDERIMVDPRFLTEAALMHDSFQEHSGRLDALERRMVAICGEDGADGKLGAMRRVLGYLATLALGGLVSGLASIYSAGQRAGEQDAIIRRMERDVAAQATQIRDLEHDLSELRGVLRRERKPQPVLRPDGD